jgi:hypothetical protein
VSRSENPWRSPLVDDVIGTQKDCRTNAQLEGPRCLEVEDELEFRRPLNGQVRGMHTLEDAIDERPSALFGGSVSLALVTLIALSTTSVMESRNGPDLMARPRRRSS